MPSYKFAAGAIAEDDDDFDAAVASAHQTKERPVCLCQTPNP